MFSRKADSFKLLVFASIIAVLLLINGLTYAQSIKIVVSDLQAWHQLESIRKAHREFAEKYPEIKVEFEPHEGVPARSKFVTAIRTRSAPDVGVLNLYWVKDFAMNGWIQPLDKFIDPDTRSDYLDSFLNYASYKGKLYGLFAYTDCSTVVYRKDLFATGGITPPARNEAWTWDEFVKAAKKLTKDTNGDGKPDVWGLGITGRREGATTYSHFPFFWALGGKLIDENGGPAFNSNAGRGALQLYHDFIYKHRISPVESYSYNWDDIARGFNAGQYAMALFGNWHPVTLEPQFPGKIGVMLYPVPKKGDKSCATSGGWVYSIMTDDPQKQKAAWTYIQFMVSKAVMSAQTKEQGTLPVRRSVYDDPYFKSEWMQVFARQLGGAHMKPGDPIYDIIQDEYTVALQEVMMDRKTPENALNDAERNVIGRAKAAGLLK